MYDHLAYGLGMGSWHVSGAWSVSQDRHRRDLGYVTLWALSGDHLAYDGHGYPAKA